MTLYTPDRSLLYPQFETYRLHPLSPEDDVSSYALPNTGPTQSKLDHAQHSLSFKETRARIGWNHLGVDGHGRGVWVDGEWKIWGFVLDNNHRPVFTLLAELPTPISTASTSSSHSPAPEYPSALALDSTTWVVNDGHGTLYLLAVSAPSDTFTGQLGRSFDLDGFYSLQAVHSGEAATVVLLSRSTYEGRKHAGFELIEVALPLTDQESLQVNWTMHGGDSPTRCSWYDEGWMILAAEAFKSAAEDELIDLSTGTAQTDKPDEPIHLADQSTKVDSQMPFSWKQTSDSASIIFTFSPGTLRSDLVFSLAATSFTLRCSDRLAQPEALARFAAAGTHSWWAPIDLDESTLSYDPVRCILEVDIAKEDSPNRWPSLFLPSDDDEGEDDGIAEFDVPETIDSNMLAAVKATFDSIKSRPAADAGDEPSGNHPAIPSLLREEMDYDMEDDEDFEDRANGVMGDQGGKVGRDVFVGYIKDGKTSWSRTSSSVVSLPFEVISDRQSEDEEQSLIIKSAVDGLIYTPPTALKEASSTSLNPTKRPWTHAHTVPALSFVLSSKRDIRLVRHLTIPSNSSDRPSAEKDYVVLAFDAGSHDAGQGNVYIYYPPTNKTTALQGVVRVSGGDRGAMLGVGAMKGRGGEKIVVVLCEKELVVLHGVL